MARKCGPSKSLSLGRCVMEDILASLRFGFEPQNHCYVLHCVDWCSTKPFGPATRPCGIQKSVVRAVFLSRSPCGKDAQAPAYNAKQALQICSSAAYCAQALLLSCLRLWFEAALKIAVRRGCTLCQCLTQSSAVPHSAVRSVN